MWIPCLANVCRKMHISPALCAQTIILCKLPLYLCYILSILCKYQLHVINSYVNCHCILLRIIMANISLRITTRTYPLSRITMTAYPLLRIAMTTYPVLKIVMTTYLVSRIALTTYHLFRITITHMPLFYICTINMFL